MTCELVKEFLSRRAVPFRSLPISEGENLAMLAARNPSLRTAPVTYVGDVEVVGWDAAALTSALVSAGIPVREVVTEAPFPLLDQTAPLPVASRFLLVTSFVESAIGSIALDGPAAPVAAVVARTRGLPGGAIAAAQSRAAGVVAVVAADAGRVVWLDARSGAPVHGTLAASSVPVGDAPLDVVADPHHPYVYVSVSERRCIVVLDARAATEGEAAIVATVATPHRPGVMAVAPDRDLLLVRQREGGTLVFAGDDLRSRPARARATSIPTPPGRGLALSPDERVLAVPHPLGDREGLALFDLERSYPGPGGEPSWVPTGALPFSVAAHPSAPIVYVSCFRPPHLELRDVRTGAPIVTPNGTATVPLPSPARAMVVDPSTDTLYVSCFDANVVLAFDAATGSPRRAGVWDTAPGPRGLLIVDTE